MKSSAVAVSLLLAACVPQLSGAPCHTDNNCPVNQYCDGAYCQSGAPPATRVVQLLVSTPAGILPLGATVQAAATAVLQSGAKQDVTASATWSTSDTRVAQVSNDAGSEGSVLAVATGEVDVDATLGGNSGSAHLIVTDAQLVYLVVTVDRPVVAARTDATCTSMGFFTDGTHADLSSLASWTSNQPTVASVSSSPGNVGALLALAPGTAQISASYQQLSGSTTVTVTDATLSALSIAPLVPWVSSSATLALAATGLFSDGTAQPMTGSVQWTVDDPSLAYFLPSPPGELQGFAPGSTVVEAQAGTLGAQAPLLVSSAPLESLDLSPVLPDPIGIGGATGFSVWGTFLDEGVLDLSSQASWSASNPGVLAVLPSSGEASGLDAGVADVQAAYGGLLAPATQTVDGATPSALLVWPPATSLTVGLPSSLAAERVLLDGAVEDVTPLVGWSSSCPAQVQLVTGARGGAVFARSARTCTATAKLNGLNGAGSLDAASRAVQRLEISPAQVVLGPGGWVALTATAIFSDGALLDVTPLAAWSSNASTLVTGNGPVAGQVFAADAGVSQLTATFGGATGSAAFSVQPQLPVLEVWPPLVQLHAGTEQTLRATAVWPAGDALDVTVWTVFASSSPEIARVANATGARGALAGLSPGTATVSALFGPVSARASVAVDGPTPQGLAISGPSTLPVGEPASFLATAHFSDGSDEDVSSQSAWTSSAPSVLRLRGTGPWRGTAAALSAGSAEAEARYAGVVGNAAVTTTEGGLQSLSIGALPSSIPSGVQLQLVATASFADGIQLDVTARTVWTSLSPDTASVSHGPPRGRMTAGLPGAAQLTANFEGQEATVSFVVSPATLSGVTILPSAPNGPVGVGVPLVAQGVFTDGSRFNLTQQARWSSANPAVVAVSNGEVTRGTAMALVSQTSSIAASVTRPDSSVVTGSAPFVGGPSVVTGVEISPASLTLSLSSGPSAKLRANAHLSDGTSQDVSSEVSWSIEVSTVAQVTASGELTALKSGNTRVLAELGALVGSASVTVGP
jgi:trimeric autotransporter adhesin